ILYYVKCAVCDALSAIRRMSDQSDKNIKTFLFFQRKKKQKNITSATSAKWNLLSCQRLKICKRQVVFFEKTTQKIYTFKPLQTFILSDWFSVPKAVLSKNKILSSFGFLVYRTKPLKIKKDTRIISRIFCISIILFF